MAVKRNGLGKGLDSLIPDKNTKNNTTYQVEEKLWIILGNQIILGKFLLK